MHNYVFDASPEFWDAFRKLSNEDKDLAREKFKIFKKLGPSSLKSHKINKLTALYGTVVRSVTVRGDLKVAFMIKDNVIISLDIGSHIIYENIEE